LNGYETPDSIRVFDIGKGHLDATGLMSASDQQRMLLHYHRQAGEQLVSHYGKRAPQIATQLALHFEGGRDFERAVEYLIHAGDNATKLYANAEAAEHYTRALSLVEKLAGEAQAETLVTLYEKRGAVNMTLSRFPESIEDYTNMLKHQETLGSPEKQAARALAPSGRYAKSSRNRRTFA